MRLTLNQLYTMRNGVQLIAYANSLGGNLASLADFMEKHGKGVLSGVHILPFFPSSGDRGFAPLTYEEVDPVFGDWNDVERIAKNFDLMVDVMANHLSRQSPQFQDYLENGEDSEWKDFFLRFKNVWPEGEAPESDLARIYTRKPRPPYTEVTRKDGVTEKIWCTFDYEQIDLDVDQEVTRRYFLNTIEMLARHGATGIRLDAFAYTVKRAGTNCFFVEPDVWEVLDYFRKVAAENGALILPEIHEHYTIQQKLADRDYPVYDFALPMLVLHTVYSQSAARLKHWLKICPRNQYTTLDTHDGIGVVDVADLLSPEEVEIAKESLFSKGANVKAIYNSSKYGNLDIYQLNCTYYSALGDSDINYLIARTIQFFAPGTPQIYYVGLLAGSNDIELVERTKQGRDINRHDYTQAEIDEALKRPVVKNIFQLMRLRNQHPAFDGELVIHDSGDDVLRLSYKNGEHSCSAEINLRQKSVNIVASSCEGIESETIDWRPSTVSV